MKAFVAGALALAAATAGAQPECSVERTGAGITLSNGIVRVAVSRGSGSIREEYSARRGGWHLLLASSEGRLPDPEIYCDGRITPLLPDTIRVAAQSPDSVTVEAVWRDGSHTLRKLITLKRGESAAGVVVRLAVQGAHELARALSSYAFLPGGARSADPDFVWTPQLRPDSTDVIADHTFRTPAILVQKEGFLAALIPDIDRIQPWRGVETAADLQIADGSSPVLRYGGMNWRTRSHVFYTHTGSMTTQLVDGGFTYGYTLLLAADAEPRLGYRSIARYAWKRWGRANLASGIGPQGAPFSDYIRKAWKEYIPQIAVKAELEGTPVTLLTQGRLAWSNRLHRGADTDCWFNVWFNALRTAYGISVHARKTGDTSLSRLAAGVLNLALLAPQKRGLTPSVFYLDSSGGHWVNDHGWGGIEGGRNYAMFHNCWTGIWLLAWGEHEPSRREEILRAVAPLGDFLLKSQRPGGVIPSWYDPATLEPVETFREENAETAGAAYFLAELYRRTREGKYLAGAERAMAYINREIVPRQKWYDFETFFSCTRKEVGFADPFTRQVAQNTLSMHQAAEAALSLNEITGKAAYLKSGIGFIDYLSLYQQVWSPPWLSRQLFGGFGVQNTDGEWSDSRQGYFAVTLMRYYEATGEREYFERAVAALRAMFSLFESPTSPRTWENYAHGGSNRPGGVTGIHWGTGSSVVSIHLLEERYGGAHVNVGKGWGCGIDGCTVSGVTVRENRIDVAIRSDLPGSRRLRVTFGGMAGGAYDVTINGSAFGRLSAADLERGCEITL